MNFISNHLISLWLLIGLVVFSTHATVLLSDNNGTELEFPVVALSYNRDINERSEDLAYLTLQYFENLNRTVYILNENNSRQLLESETGMDFSDGILYVSLIREPIDPLLVTIERLLKPAFILITGTPRVSTLYPGRSMYQISDHISQVPRRLPVYEVGFGYSANITKLCKLEPDSNRAKSTCTINQLIPEPNQWARMFHSRAMTVFRTCYIIVSLAAICLAIARLVQFKNSSVIVTACCSLHLISNTIRLIYVCIDPFFSDQMLPIAGQEILLTITYPIVSAASLILSFYWFETISGYNGITVPKFLKKLKIPFIVIIGSLVVEEIVVASIRAARVGNTRLAIQIGGIIYLITCTVLYIFYLCMACILVVKLNKIKQKKRNKRTTYQITTHIMVIGSSIGGFVTSIGLIFVQLPLFFTPDGWFATWILIFGGFLITSLMQMIMIRPKSKSSNSSTTSSPRGSSSGSKQTRTTSSFNLSPRYSGTTIITEVNNNNNNITSNSNSMDAQSTTSHSDD